jgi:spore germination protein YaaH
VRAGAAASIVAGSSIAGRGRPEVNMIRRFCLTLSISLAAACSAPTSHPAPSQSQSNPSAGADSARTVLAQPSPSDGPVATPDPTPPAPTGGSGSAPVNRHRFCGWTLATGYAPEDSDPGFLAFAAHADQFDAVHPIWWHIGADPTSFTRIYGEGSPTVLNHTTWAGQRTLLIPTIAAVDGGDPGQVSTMLHDANLVTQHIANIRALVASHKYDGIDLDYEHLPDSDRDAFSAFAQQLAQGLHSDGKTLSFAVQAVTRAAGVWDYDVLSQVSDQVHLMTYDFHFLGSHPGPISPLGWDQDVFQYISSVAGGARNGKFLVGLANYALAGSDSGSTGWTGSAMDAINLAGGSYATTTDHMTSCPYVEAGHPIASGRAPNAYTSQGHTYFEDLASMEEKVTAAQAAGLGGVTYFTIGGEPDRPGPQDFFSMVRGHYPQ